MEEFLLKTLAEFGFPALISLYLLTKGVNTMNKFAETITKLAESISRLEKRLDIMEINFQRLFSQKN